jgi:hypothetical protein
MQLQARWQLQGSWQLQASWQVSAGWCSRLAGSCRAAGGRVASGRRGSRRPQPRWCGMPAGGYMLAPAAGQPAVTGQVVLQAS